MKSVREKVNCLYAGGFESSFVSNTTIPFKNPGSKNAALSGALHHARSHDDCDGYIICRCRIDDQTIDLVVYVASCKKEDS